MVKEFKTLTIRDLDNKDNEDIIKIMNEVMEYSNLKTGQQVFETIVRQYDFGKHELQNEKQKRKKEVSELQDKCLKLEEELKMYKRFHSAFGLILDSHNQIIDSKN